jgi:hypothetical protein
MMSTHVDLGFAILRTRNVDDTIATLARLHNKLLRKLWPGKEVSRSYAEPPTLTDAPMSYAEFEASVKHARVMGQRSVGTITQRMLMCVPGVSAARAVAITDALGGTVGEIVGRAERGGLEQIKAGGRAIGVVEDRITVALGVGEGAGGGVEQKKATKKWKGGASKTLTERAGDAAKTPTQLAGDAAQEMADDDDDDDSVTRFPTPPKKRPDKKSGQRWSPLTSPPSSPPSSPDTLPLAERLKKKSGQRRREEQQPPSPPSPPSFVDLTQESLESCNAADSGKAVAVSKPGGTPPLVRAPPSPKHGDKENRRKKKRSKIKLTLTESAAAAEEEDDECIVIS